MHSWPWRGLNKMHCFMSGWAFVSGLRVTNHVTMGAQTCFVEGSEKASQKLPCKGLQTVLRRASQKRAFRRCQEGRDTPFRKVQARKDHLRCGSPPVVQQPQPTLLAYQKTNPPSPSSRSTKNQPREPSESPQQRALRIHWRSKFPRRASGRVVPLGR